MTEEEKKELLVALCGYLPYGLVVQYKQTIYEPKKVINVDVEVKIDNMLHHRLQLLDFKPYLRPMNSMTLEETEELDEMGLQTKTGSFKHYIHITPNFTGFLGRTKLNPETANPEVSGINIIDVMFYINWLNAHHLDYGGLIEKGIALEAPQNMYQ